MSKFDSKKVMPRYAFLAVIMTLVAISVLGKTLYIMTAKRAYWEEVADRVKVDSLKTQPMRGNILSCDGQLMASSLPQYNIFMDFKALRVAKKDTLFCEKIDSICTGLNAIFPDRTAAEFKKHLMEGFEKNKQHWPVWNRRINYSTFSEVRRLPVFRLKANRTLSDDEIKNLLTDGHTKLLKGFKSKQGKSFDAVVAFDGDYNTVFVFPERKSKATSAKRRK